MQMSVLAANCHFPYSKLYQREQQQQQQLLPSGGSSSCMFVQKSFWIVVDPRNNQGKKHSKIRDIRVEAFWSNFTRPSSIDMEAINDCDHLDQILLQAKELNQPVVIDWMAAWCRKCIYLKPNVEKLAAEYDKKVKFYYVDVNKVPQALVKRGNIAKMPTIQLWKDGEMKEEVIGGHKAWLVVEEVREMIQKFV